MIQRAHFRRSISLVVATEKSSIFVRQAPIGLIRMIRCERSKASLRSNAPILSLPLCSCKASSTRAEPFLTLPLIDIWLLINLETSNYSWLRVAMAEPEPTLDASAASRLAAKVRSHKKRRCTRRRWLEQDRISLALDCSACVVDVSHHPVENGEEKKGEKAGKAKRRLGDLHEGGVDGEQKLAIVGASAVIESSTDLFRYISGDILRHILSYLFVYQGRPPSIDQPNLSCYEISLKAPKNFEPLSPVERGKRNELEKQEQDRFEKENADFCETPQVLQNLPRLVRRLETIGKLWLATWWILRLPRKIITPHDLFKLKPCALLLPLSSRPSAQLLSKTWEPSGGRWAIFRWLSREILRFIFHHWQLWGFRTGIC